jgi:hypothetical protein
MVLYTEEQLDAMNCMHGLLDAWDPEDEDTSRVAGS